jgi:hypothetical protein
VTIFKVVPVIALFPNKPTIQAASQLSNQATNHPPNQPTNQTTNQTQQPADQGFKQANNHLTKQQKNQLRAETCMGLMSQPFSLLNNSLHTKRVVHAWKLCLLGFDWGVLEQWVWRLRRKPWRRVYTKDLLPAGETAIWSFGRKTLVRCMTADWTQRGCV